MTTVRVAIYPVDRNSIDELTRKVDDELVPTYKDQDGFDSLSVVNAGDSVVSISRWDSQDHAEAGAKAALEWAKTQPGITGPPSASHIGEEINSG